MDLLFISARYIYSEGEFFEKIEELPLFKRTDLVTKIKKFSQKGNTIVFIDVWPTYKKNNKELVEFFGREKDRGEILFYCPGYVTKKLIDNNDSKEVLDHKKFLDGISLGTNICDINLLFDRIGIYFFKKNKKINNVFFDFGNFDYYTPIEKQIFNTIIENVEKYNYKKKSHEVFGIYQSCERPPVKILFTDKEGTLFGSEISEEQQNKNKALLQEFTDEGNIVVILTKGHGACAWKGFEIGYSNHNLYGMVISEMASVCINDSGGIIENTDYPSLSIAINYHDDKKDAVKLFLNYFLEMGYRFNGIYAIGDSEDDFGMIEYVNNIGGIAKIIGINTTSFSDFLEQIENEKSKKLVYTKY